MKTIKGDLIQMALNGEFDVIVHGCNCFCTMGRGIAKQIKQTFPAAYEADLATPKGDKSKLGTISWAEVNINNQSLFIVNAYTQFHWKGRGKKVDYNAIETAFSTIQQQFTGLRIGYPAIGAGLGGGDWNSIAERINKSLKSENHTFVQYAG